MKEPNPVRCWCTCHGYNRLQSITPTGLAYMVICVPVQFDAEAFQELTLGCLYFCECWLARVIYDSRSK